MSKWHKCSIASCLRIAKARGLCDGHYKRLRATGNLKQEVPIGLLRKRKLQAFWNAL